MEVLLSTVYQGQLKKLKSTLPLSSSSPIQYTLPIGEDEIPLNSLIGKSISLEFVGEIRCQACQKKTKKSYSQGYCFVCSQQLARCDLCIVKPETCHYALGTCREPEWGDMHCMIPHIVYLANTSGLKVGITRETQIPTRWIDQGATQALPIIRAPTRRLSGLIEVILAQHVADKTDWRKMLKGANEPIDLNVKKQELLARCKTELDHLSQEHPKETIEYLTLNNPQILQYPVQEYPIKVVSLNIEKTPKIVGTLMGIKGQYLIFDIGVLNVRNLRGMVSNLDIGH